ncbi:MAG: class I SAM-dependent methyltransferase, partial [Nitrospinales bacterium]
MGKTDFSTVTELSGDEVSREQVQRIANRYYWSASFCEGKDVLEVACGTGQGLGFLKSKARFLVAGDFSEEVLQVTWKHYAGRLPLMRFDAQHLPFRPASFNVVIIFEAVYYVPEADRFVAECRRVLKPGGTVLLVTSNKDLFDFNPSPFSHRYFGVLELESLFKQHGFAVKCYGDTPVNVLSWHQKLVRLVKALAVRFDLIPKTMAGKKLLKRLVFGSLVPMPTEIDESTGAYVEPAPLP